MKFLTNPDKIWFFVGVGIFGFLIIFFGMFLNELLSVFLIPAEAAWILVLYYLIKFNYTVYEIKEDKFIIKNMNKEYEINFEEIENIIEFKTYTNPIRIKRYEIVLSDTLNIKKRLLEIENQAFSKWISKNSEKFSIRKQYFFD